MPDHDPPTRVSAPRSRNSSRVQPRSAKLQLFSSRRVCAPPAERPSSPARPRHQPRTQRAGRCAKQTTWPGPVQRLVRPLGARSARPRRRSFEPRTAELQLLARSVARRGAATLLFARRLRSNGRTTQLSSRGRSVSYESGKAYMRPRSAAAPGSAQPPMAVVGCLTSRPSLRSRDRMPPALRPNSATNCRTLAPSR